MYNNNYTAPYTPQMNIDRINEQITHLETMKKQIEQQTKQPTNLTQNFQLAPTNRDTIKYASSIDEVDRDMVVGDTPYFSRDMSVVWIKNTKGEIKSYKLEEIVQQDDRDILIQSLQMQVEELRKEVKENAKSINDDVNETTTSKKSSSISNARTSTKKSK